ncbi:MAG: helix-turn-helix transcriptional regulator [Clostridia bacterium]|nr:helix-turn-helix transcriptional regulator [Clostridia bacterium]
MNSEFTIDVNGVKANVYMQIGFFDHEDILYPLHRHRFAEMHVFLCGNALLRCDDKDVLLCGGDVICVPANMPHQYLHFDRESKRISFLVDCIGGAASPIKTSVSKDFLSLLCIEIKEYVLFGKDSKLKPLLSYICSDFFISEQKKTMSPIKNRELIMDEFFSKKYNSCVRLEELAKELGLGNKQTEREVKKITGNTFTAELSKRRIEAAVALTQTTDLPLVKISELVGYSSYCGFYKAYKRIVASSSRRQDKK